VRREKKKRPFDLEDGEVVEGLLLALDAFNGLFSRPHKVNPES
jgi:hypothetical protein